MRSIFLSAIILFLYLNANADWVLDKTILKIDTKQSDEIAMILKDFPQTLNYLNAINLTSPSRVVVKEFKASIANYRWENDNDCKVPDPSKVDKVQLSSSGAAFIYENEPNNFMIVQADVGATSPCNGLKSIKNFKKNKVK